MENESIHRICPRVSRRVLVALALLAPAGAGLAGSSISEDGVLVASDGVTDDVFGHAVAMSGTTIVVGAYGDDDGDEDGGTSGAAYIFERPVDGWTGELTEVAKLTATGAERDDLFGFTVAISGNTVVVGAPYEDGAAGAAYVFVAGPEGWSGDLTESARLTSSDRMAVDQFGTSVAISGDTVVVGAPFHDTNAPGIPNEQGAVYVFEAPPGGWSGALTEEAKLTLLDPGELGGDRFGSSVAISGGVLVAGAPDTEADETVSTGSAFIFLEPLTGWGGALNESARLLPPVEQSFARFGSQVAVSDSIVVIGVAGESNFAAADGAAYVFEEPFGGWSGSPGAVARLTASDPSPSLNLARSVAVMENQILLGAREFNDGDDFGAAYLFSKPPSGWEGSLNEDVKFVVSEPAMGEGLGQAVALGENLAVVGAPALGIDAGSAYFYNLDGIFSDGFESGQAIASALQVP